MMLDVCDLCETEHTDGLLVARGRWPVFLCYRCADACALEAAQDDLPSLEDAPAEARF